MEVRVQWLLEDENAGNSKGGKWFLSHLFFQKEEDGTFTVGLMKRNGDDYAYATLTKQEFLGTIKALGLLEEDTNETSR